MALSVKIRFIVSSIIQRSTGFVLQHCFPPESYFADTPDNWVVLTRSIITSVAFLLDCFRLFPTKIVCVRNISRKKDWLAIICTNTTISEEEIICIYGKRWDIEVFFKTCKSYLHLIIRIGPSKGQHVVTALEFHRAVVKDFRQKFCFPWTRTVKQTVIYNEDIPAVFICKGLHEDIDDSGGKQCCKTKSVDLWIIEETVNCVFTERAVKYTCFPLHIHTSIRKSEAEQISKHFD